MANRYRAESNRYAYAEARVAQMPNVSSSLWQAVSNYRPHRNPKATGVLVLWLFGLFAVFLSPAPVKITPEKLARYDQLILQVSSCSASADTYLGKTLHTSELQCITGSR